MKTINIDGTDYNVRISFPSIERNFELVEGQNGGLSLSFRTIRDIGGTAYTYTMQVEPEFSDPTSYDAFYEAISAPVPYHSVTVPYGQTTLTFDAQIISGSDTYRGKASGSERWGGLSVTFIPIQPQKGV